jgi:hypothetical protein
MIPLSREYFSQQDLSYELNLFGANAYADISKGGVPPKFPMCYIGGRVKSWKAVMGTRSGDLHRELSAALSGRSDGWDNDEEYFAAQLLPHAFYQGAFTPLPSGHFAKGACECITRKWSPLAHLRIDRAAWQFRGEPDLIDCHAYRPGYDSTDVLLRLLNGYFPESQGYFRNYLHEFLELKCSV